jgi:hypothetical protein
MSIFWGNLDHIRSNRTLLRTQVFTIATNVYVFLRNANSNLGSCA